MELYLRYPDFKTKVVTLSYDDGPEHDRRMIEILDKFGIKCTFNLISGSIDKKTEEEKQTFIKLYKDTVHEVACHTVSHPHLNNLSTAEIVNEVINDRIFLEKYFGTIAYGMAYPFGYTYKEGLLEALKLCGIKYARTTQSTHGFNLPADWLLLNPTCHHNDPKLFELVDEFLKPDDIEHPWRIKTKMFYMWGHSYEFPQQNNWNVLEEFCRKIANRDDVWYATNAQIYNYVEAYNNLKKSADGNIVYNASSTDVYVRTAANNLVIIKAGETVNL